MVTKFKKKDHYLSNIVPYDHQHHHFNSYRDVSAWGFLWDMGTGKTKMIIDLSVYLYKKGLIDCVVIIAPNDVHADHLNIALPNHIHPSIEYISFIYRAQKHNGKKVQEDLTRLLKEKSRLVFASFNTDALRSGTKGWLCVQEFLQAFRCYMAIDEYTDFKNPKSKRSKGLLAFTSYPRYKIILDGTPIHKGPLDAWVGFNFLQPGCLGYRSFTAFKNRYCKLENWKLRNDIYTVLKQSPAYKHLEYFDVESQKVKRNIPKDELTCLSSLTNTIYDAAKQYKVREQFLVNILPDYLQDTKSRILPLCGRTYFQVTEYRHLDELKKSIDSISSRYLKSECLDLPPKTDIRLPYTMDKETKKIYDSLKNTFMVEYAGGHLTIPNILTMYLRLQQVLGGHLTIKTEFNTEIKVISTQRLDLLMWQLGKLPEAAKVLIFCRFKPEIVQIVKAINKQYGHGSAVDYYGETTAKDRTFNKHQFIHDLKCLAFVANRKSGGVGLDGLQVANYVIHYSKDWSSRLQNQSTDRADRSGQKRNLTVIHITALNSIDIVINKILSDNKNVADEITGDNLILFNED